MKKYIFKPYSNTFPKLFECEKKRILASLKVCLDIQHVGSTAIPDLGGKGIIDIALAIKRTDVDKVSEELQKLGYVFRKDWSTPERLFFRNDLPDLEESTRRYHLHLTFLDSNEWKNLIYFRNYLISHPESAAEYAKLKKEAVQQADEDDVEYRRIKSPFFINISEKIKDSFKNGKDLAP